MILAPSILAADFTKLGEQLTQTREAGISWIHFDVMDGVFVPSISFGLPVLESIRPFTGQKLDVHLMIVDPIRYVKQFAQAGADLITVHLEACQDKTEETLQLIHSLGKLAGLAISPDTPWEAVLPYLSLCDLVLVMTVHPGFGGQKLIPQTLEKVCALKKAIEESGRSILLETDGGIHAGNLAEVCSAGSDMLVCGSAVFRGSIKDNIQLLTAQTEKNNG